MSFSPATPTLAIGYGEEVAITGMKSNPYGLHDNEKLLPKATVQLETPAGKSLELVAMSLHFLKRNQLVVTYLNYGAVWASWITVYNSYAVLTWMNRCWDLPTMSVTGRITPGACSMFVIHGFDAGIRG